MIISLVITVLVLAIVFGLIYWIVGLLPIAQPFKNIVLAIIGLIFVLYLLGAAFGYGGIHPVRIT